MQDYLAVLAIVILIAMVLTRTLLMKRKGIQAMNFGKMDKKDFLILPFALFYFYLIIADAFRLPSISHWVFFHSGAVEWVGVGLCAAGLIVMLFSLISFGRSFRVGIDMDHPDKLVTTGIFAVTRNPIYVAFGLVLLGQFLAFPNWILLVYACAGIWLFHRQIVREEEYLKEHYGAVYIEYCRRVRRYL
jgi:protein-S-isoprenylcysteine O-methyltransferase Ste14